MSRKTLMGAMAAMTAATVYSSAASAQYYYYPQPQPQQRYYYDQGYYQQPAYVPPRIARKQAQQSERFVQKYGVQPRQQYYYPPQYYQPQGGYYGGYGPRVQGGIQFYQY